LTPKRYFPKQNIFLLLAILLCYEWKGVIALKVTPIQFQCRAFVLKRLNDKDCLNPFSIKWLTLAIFPVQSAIFHTQIFFYSLLFYERGKVVLSQTIDTELHCFAAFCCALLSTDPKSYKRIQHFQVSCLGLIKITINLITCFQKGLFRMDLEKNH